MIRIIPFEPEHIYGMKPLMQDPIIAQMCKDKTYLENLKKLGPCYTGYSRDDILLGAAGVHQINAKTYEGWAILSDKATSYSKGIIKAIDFFIKNMFEFDAVDRFQATVRMNFAAGHRFARVLKFAPEGILKNYEYDEDYMMYSRINTWLK